MWVESDLFTREVDAAHASERLHFERVVRTGEVGPARPQSPLDCPQWHTQFFRERPGVGTEAVQFIGRHTHVELLPGEGQRCPVPVENRASERRELDAWLAETDTQVYDPVETEAASDAGTDTEGPPPSKEEKKKKKKASQVPGTWKKHKTTAAAPSDAAANTLKNFFRTRGG